MMQGNDSIVSSRPDTEIFVVKSAEKSRLADGKGTGIKPKINPNNEN